MTADQLTDLQATAARLYEIAAYHTPHYAQPDLQAAWADLCELIGLEAEQIALHAAQAMQTDMFAEAWGPV